MQHTTTRTRLMASSMICGAAFALAVPAFAQEATVEEVIITGSRIARQDYIANSPVSTVSSEAIQATGATNTEEVMNRLPQVVPGFSAASNNPSDGTATVDLRGLGPTRTLVLVNGRRINPATRLNAADLNTIPTALIERVEVVTGGASAVYGSDALAGVVNFILKRDFEGVELGGQYGISKYGDNETYNGYALVGANSPDGKGNVTAYLSIYDRSRVLPNSDRPWSLTSNAGGSGTGARGGLNSLPGNPYGGSLSSPQNVRYAFNNNGTPRPFVNDFGLGPTSDRYDFTPVNNIMSPGKRLNAAMFGRYDLTEAVEFTTELVYSDSRNSAQLAPTPATGIQIPYNNAFVTPALASLLATRPNPTAPMFFDRRMAELGPRIDKRDADMYQANLGLNADLGSGWRAEGYYSYGRTEFRSQILNDVSRSRVAAAVAAGGTTTACAPGSLAIYANCAPLNMFGAGTISPAAADFVRLNFSDLNVFSRNLVSGFVSGPLFKLPAGDLSVALGGEYRKDQLNFTPDAAKASGDVFGFNAERPVAGSVTVKELYAEAVVPLVADVTGFKYLGLELGARLSDYSSVGRVTSYKAGVEYKPFDQIRFRGMYQRASRAPSVFELFQSNDQGFPQFIDPCSTRHPATAAARSLSASTRAFCTAQLGFDPVANGFIALNTQTETFFYGNPNLAEERSETLTAGVVLQPSFAPGLTATIDYHDINVKDYIGTIEGGVAGIVGACFASGDMTSSACFNDVIGLPLIYRDAAGTLKARALLDNVSALRVKGVDFAINYGWNVPWAGGLWGDKLNIDLNVTYLKSYVLDGIDYADTAGFYNISATLPEWKGNLRMSYDVGPVNLAYTGTYIGAMDNQGNIPAFEDGGYTTVKAFIYHDVSARWGVTEKVELFGGVRNLTNKRPPIFDNANDGNTDPNTYDIVGRNYFVGAKLRF